MLNRIILLIFITVYSIECNELPAEFVNLLDKCNLIFNEPGEINLVPAEKDTLMEHSIRYYSPESNLELKIQIIPLDTAEKYSDPKIFSVYKSGTYKDSKIKTELFNSDHAALAEFDLIKGTYDNKYKHCVIIWIHKNKQAGVYVCLTGNDKDKMIEFGKKYIINKDMVIIKFRD